MIVARLEPLLKDQDPRHIICVSDVETTICHAVWGNLKDIYNRCSFVAFDSLYDANHIFIYWSVRSDGFYHSLDNINYHKVFYWGH